MPTTYAAVSTPRLATTQPVDFHRLEFALTEDEIAKANILQFDPDATVAPTKVDDARSGDANAYLAVPGYIFSPATWRRLAVGAFGGRPDDALARFILLRSRHQG